MKPPLIQVLEEKKLIKVEEANFTEDNIQKSTLLKEKIPSIDGWEILK